MNLDFVNKSPAWLIFTYFLSPLSVPALIKLSLLSCPIEVNSFPPPETTLTELSADD